MNELAISGLNLAVRVLIALAIVWGIYILFLLIRWFIDKKKKGGKQKIERGELGGDLTNQAWDLGEAIRILERVKEEEHGLGRSHKTPASGGER